MAHFKVFLDSNKVFSNMVGSRVGFLVPLPSVDICKGQELVLMDRPDFNCIKCVSFLMEIFKFFIFWISRFVVYLFCVSRADGVLFWSIYLCLGVFGSIGHSPASNKLVQSCGYES